MTVGQDHVRGWGVGVDREAVLGVPDVIDDSPATKNCEKRTISFLLMYEKKQKYIIQSTFA